MSVLKPIIVSLVLLSLLTAQAVGFSAASGDETAAINAQLEGVALEIDAGNSVLIDSTAYDEVLVLINSSTTLNTDRPIAVGDYIFVDYNGMMTRSLPPQVTADTISMYCLQGEVTEVYPDQNAVLLNTETSGDVYVRLPEGWEDDLSPQQQLIVYFNGVMTMSLPGQINASLIYVQ